MSLKQVIDEIVKRIRKTEPERQSEDLENAKEQSGKTEDAWHTDEKRLRKKQDQKNDDRKNVSDSDTKISNVCRRISTVIHGNMDSTREWQTGDNG